MKNAISHEDETFEEYNIKIKKKHRFYKILRNIDIEYI